MALLNIGVARENQRYRRIEHRLVNNTGATLVAGQVIAIDFTADGDALSAIAISTDFIRKFYQKAIVTDPAGAGVATGVVFTAILQGQLPECRLKGSTLAQGQPLVCGGTVATGGGSLTPLAEETVGTVGSGISPSFALGFCVAGVTVASSSYGLTGAAKVVFDGTHVNGVLIAHN